MLYFLYMSTTTIPNTLFHHNLSNGIIEYVNKYPFVVVENQQLNNTDPTNITQQLNISLLDAQKHILKYTNLIGFTFNSASVPNIQDISRGTIGDASFYKNNSTLSSNAGTIVYLIKNNGMSEAQYTETDGDYYFGDLDYVKFTIPTSDVASIRDKTTNLSNNLDTFINFTPVDILGDVNTITKQAVGNEELYVEYYFYVWEDINGPWYNGSTLSMSPNSNQLVSNETIRDVSFNGITNSTQITNADINGKNLYTYNYFGTTASDTSSNYIKVFKLTGTYGTNDGLPEQPSIIIPSPKYTKYNFIWTYSIKNGYNLTFNYKSGQQVTYLLEGSSPFFTPIINITGTSWVYDAFTTMGSLSTHYTSKSVERIYKAVNQPEISYNTQVITLTIPEQDRYDISENFIKRYQPDDRQGNKYLINAVDRTEYQHLHEDNEIVRLVYNIYIFTNEEIQYGHTSDNTPIDLSNNLLTQNTSAAYPYQDNFVDISYTQLIELSDNQVYFKTFNGVNIDYGDIPYTGTVSVNGVDVSRNRYNNENDIDGDAATVQAQTVLNADTIDKYFAFEFNSNLNVEVVRIRSADLLNLPNYAHLVTTPDWDVTYKFFNVNPTSHSTNYTMDSNRYFIRWNYSTVRYRYNKNAPIDYTQSYFNKTAFNSGISNLTTFDFTEFNRRVYPNTLLDLSYTSLPHYTNNVVDYYYKNLNITIPQSTLDQLSTNIFYNHNENARAKINIYILKPDNLTDADQGNNYDTRDIDYDTFDLSYSFYDANRIVPLRQNISIDISENGRDNSLTAGQYTIEWDYDISENGGIPAPYLPFDKSSSSGEYQVNSTIIDVSFSDFLYDLSGVYVYSNSAFTNLFLEFAQEDIERFVDYINKYHKTLDKPNTFISFDFNLLTPNKEQTQSTGFVWSLPDGYQGRDDPRLYQSPTTYINKTIIPSPILSHVNSNVYGDVGFDSRYFSYINSTNEFYKLVNVYDISNTTNTTLGNDISNSLSDIKTYIVEMYIPEGETNHTDASANFGVGNISNFSLQSIETSEPGVHLGLLTDSSNNTIVYYNNEIPYTIDTVSGESLHGKIRWMMEETSTGAISVTVSVNNKKGVYLQEAGVPATSLTILGTGTTDMSQNNSTIKIYDKRDNSQNILMSDISRTDIIFHQIRDPAAVGGVDTFPQSHIHTNATFQIPYICRMDYNIHDKTSNFKFSSVIRTTNNKLNNVYHRLQDWDISNNTYINGTTNYFFNITAQTPFTHKYIYGVGFISPFDYDIVDFYYPGKLDISYNESRRFISLQIPDIQILYLKFNMVELWNAINDATSVKFRYYGWEPRSTKITSLLSNGLDPNLENNIDAVVTELSGVEITNTNIDFLYEVDSNVYYEFNYPQIPKSVFLIDEYTLKAGIYYIAWTYNINNTYNVNKIPPTRDYDISLATIVIQPFPHKPSKPTIVINNNITEDISQVELFISEAELNDLSRNIYVKNHEYNDISEVKIHYYLWTPDDVYREDNTGGWILPEDYKGLEDIRIKEYPSIYYDETEKINKFYDLSYNGGYGIDKNKAHVKTLVGKDLRDLSKAIFTLADLNVNSLPYSSSYLKNGNMVPYIGIWGYELVMKSTSLYSGISIQSDISNTTNANFIFRKPDWKVGYELIFNNNKTASNASLNTSDFYNYSANSVVDDVTNNIRQFTKLKLQVIPGTNNLQFYKLDTSGNNVLLNTLQINETSFNNDTIYLYNLYSTQGIQTDVEIPSTAEGGSWTFNTTTGRIIFQSQPQAPIDIINTPIYFTFYKRVDNDPLDDIFKKSQASFKTTTFNKYFYTSALLIEPPPVIEPQLVYNSYRCTDTGCPKETTKTNENRNFVMRYASLFDIDFSKAAKIRFDCGR